ncbi:Survival motor neuron domain-containing protein [Strongyloides ratti]|uniref:Survival motor neuron domain-containing protein n=1 Tax=Strongyloides ratti TaxID=34506 RepID=A0A090LKC6_STRRB|nr:Survival motor neuron domain-containing protein [Strongyloides ratti]CEF68010.1 Survival motor neuron domain-containing protein [Strongyloides ratti]
MWSECEKKFWQQIVDEKNYDANYLNSVFSFVTSDILDLSLDTISEIPLRDNTKIYSEIVDNDNTKNDLVNLTIDLNNFQIGSKVLALYEEDNEYYVASVVSINLLKKTVNVVYEGFEEEGEYEVLISDIDIYNKDVEASFSDKIFDNEMRNLIMTEEIKFPLENDSKVFAEYNVDGMYYLGSVINFDKKKSSYEIIFSGFQEEGIFEVESSRVLKCSSNCYSIADDTIFMTPFKFPELCEDKEELIDSYLLSKHHSEALYKVLQEVITNCNIDGLKDNIPEFIKKYIDDDLITFDKLLSIYVFTEFLAMCFQKSYYDIKNQNVNLLEV